MAIVENDYAAYLKTSDGEIPLRDLDAQKEISSLSEEVKNIDYIVFYDKINKLTFSESGTASSKITLVGNTITGVSVNRDEYNAFLNVTLFEKDRKYKVVTKVTNNSDHEIKLYFNAFDYAFKASIGAHNSIMAGKTSAVVADYECTADNIRGFSVLINTYDDSSFTAEIYVYDVTDRDYVDDIDFSVGGVEIKIPKYTFSDPYKELVDGRIAFDGEEYKSIGEAIREQCKYIYNIAIGKPYSGMKLLTYGDSITAQRTWQGSLKETLGFETVYNKGISGIRLMQMATDEYLSTITETDFDVMLIMGGVNDFVQDRSIGSIDDVNTDDQSFTGTFYGGMNSILDKLTTRYPDKLIIFMTPTQVYINDSDFFFNKTGSGIVNSNGNTLRDFSDAVINTCKKWNVPCLDLNSLIGWNKNNISTFVKNEGNYIHPNLVGGKRMSEWISGFLTTHINL